LQQQKNLSREDAEILHEVNGKKTILFDDLPGKNRVERVIYLLLKCDLSPEAIENIFKNKISKSQIYRKKREGF
jgi:hypothetical protein